MNINEDSRIELDDLADLAASLLKAIIAVQQRWVNQHCERDRAAMYIAIHAAGAAIASAFPLERVVDDESIGDVREWVRKIELTTSDRAPETAQKQALA